MINADEIASILKAQIEQFKTEIQEDEIGTVISYLALVGAKTARRTAGQSPHEMFGD